MEGQRSGPVQRRLGKWRGQRRLWRTVRSLWQVVRFSSEGGGQRPVSSESPSRATTKEASEAKQALGLEALWVSGEQVGQSEAVEGSKEPMTSGTLSRPDFAVEQVGPGRKARREVLLLLQLLSPSLTRLPRLCPPRTRNPMPRQPRSLRSTDVPSPSLPNPSLAGCTVPPLRRRRHLRRRSLWNGACLWGRRVWKGPEER